jgi:hypothetical protein
VRRFRIGLDYELVRAHNVWFVLHYEAVRLAIDRGCRQLNLLQSTYPAKLELGAHLDSPVHHPRAPQTRRSPQRSVRCSRGYCAPASPRHSAIRRGDDRVTEA